MSNATNPSQSASTRLSVDDILELIADEQSTHRYAGQRRACIADIATIRVT